MSSCVVSVISLDKALVWRNGLEPGTHPESVKAFESTSEYRKEHDMREGNRDKAELDHDYLNDLVSHLTGAEHLILISSGTGKANAGQAVADHLANKHADLAKKIIEVITVDVKALTENELLKVGRERWEKYLSSGI